MSERERHTLLQATMGSHAYGLAREGSDIDTLGVFAYGTEEFWGMSRPVDSVVTHEPDVTLHEVGKFCSLAAGCNPTILELLWVDEEWITEILGFGYELRTIRESFLSKAAVRNAFGGYAMQQIRRVEQETRGAARPEKKSKNLRHCFRLLRQGTELLEAGTMSVTVPDRDMYFAFDEMATEDAVAMFETENVKFLAAAEDSTLPDAADRGTIEAVLKKIRRTYL